MLRREFVIKKNPNIPINLMKSDKIHKNPNVKTVETYSEAVRSKYLKDKESRNIRGEIYKLTPANIKKLCLNIIDTDLSAEDKLILKNFFGVNDFDFIKRKIQTFDTAKLKPICRFLKQEIGSIASHYALELIALFIDYQPRPYKKYSATNLKNENLTSYKEDIVYKNEEESRTTIIVKPKNKKLFAWVTSVSAFNKWKQIAIIGMSVLTVIVITTIYILNNKTRWMIWQNTEYVEVKFDTKKYHLNQLKLYKSERIKYFKKITVDCNSLFFNSDGTVKIWYGKNNKKELEYFTALGLHPETGKTLKPITKYMINKYICPDYLKTTLLKNK